MKFIPLSIFVVLVSLSADEIQIIDSIVDDVTELRQNYEKTKVELLECKNNLEDQKAKTDILKKELFNELQNKNTIAKPEVKSDNTDVYKKEIQNLKSQIKELKSLLKDKEKCTKNQNKFPKLVMKNEKKVQKEEKIESKVQKEKKTLQKDTQLKYFKASAFKLIKDADIYDKPDGEIIDMWTKGTSFTSNQKQSGFIKITGYFVNKLWAKTKDELWIKESEVQNKKKKN
jgi:hypothetical protein